MQNTGETSGRVAKVLDEGELVAVLARRGGRWRVLLRFPPTLEGRRLAAELVAALEAGLVRRRSDLPGADGAAA